jgi:hypothetical protein
MMFRFLFLILLSAGFLSGVPSRSSFILINQSAIARQGEPMVIGRSDFEKHFRGGKLTDVPVLKVNGIFIPTQTDDLNGDGNWDELAFVISLEAGEKLEVEAGWISKNLAPVFEKKTQVYLAEQNSDGTFTQVTQAEAPPGLKGFPARHQSEGVGWENDKIAFRIYFDCRNSKDLFGKLKPDLILHQAGTPALGSYHELAPWGMDILHCGSSLGAGGLAMMEGDSLIRLGSTPGYRYIKIADGPVRALFELRYTGWEVMNNSYEVVEKITLWLGKHWFQSEVTVSPFTGTKQLATGIVTSKLDTEPIAFQPNTDYLALLTHGKQSLNNDVLAMAVLAPAKDAPNTGRTTNVNYYQMGYQTVPAKSFSHVISETVYLYQNMANQTPSTHYFFALWGLENPAWNNLNAVKEYIRLEADKLSQPIKIEFK